MATSPGGAVTLAELLGAQVGSGDAGYSRDMDGLAYWTLLERDPRFSTADGGQTRRSYASSRSVRILQHLLGRLDRVNRLRDDLSGALGASDASDASRAQREVLEKAEACVGFALARLVAQWSDRQQEDSGDGSHPAAAPYYAVVINELVQHCAVGYKHALHEHVLVASCAHRVFEPSSSSSTATVVQWPCAQCGRILQLAVDSLVALGVRGVVHSTTSVTSVVYRCAPCKFHLCSSCFDNATGISSPTSVAPGLVVAPAAVVDVSPIYTTRPPALRVDRFFSLMLPFLETLSAQYGRIVRQLATEIRRRVFEVVLHRVLEITALTRLFRELIECPTAPLQIVQPAGGDDSAHDSSVVAWLPPSVVTWKMAMLSFLGPFFRATTISKELAVRATGQLSALRADWGKGYDGGLKMHLVAIMQRMLADSQHPLVVDAAISWLATVVTSVNKRRLVNHDADDGLDGFLINVSQVLACLAQRILRRATDGTSRGMPVIDPEYHQGFVSIRGFGDKDNPEIRLRDRSADEKKALMSAEEAKIRALDRQSIRDFKRQGGSSGPEDTCPVRLSTHYYPDMQSNYGVRCDLCETPDFEGPRYKCALCEDADLCEACFQVYSAQSTADPRRPGDNADSQAVNNLKARLVAGTVTAEAVHSLDHVFFRVSVPVPLCNAMHFEWMDFDRTGVSYGAEDDRAKAGGSMIRCADCACLLDDVDVLYRCSNCFDARFVCLSCLATEEKHHNPHTLHAPGHVYFAITRGWRRLYSPHARALHFRSLSFLSSLVPRVRSEKASDLFHLAIKCMHLGPLATLQRYLRALKEAQELEAFCYCEEETLQYEKASQGGGRTLGNEERSGPRAGSTTRHTGPHRRRSAKMSSYYNSSKARSKEMMASRLAMEIQLLSPDNVARWLSLYAKTSRWLLGVASSSENAFCEVLTAPSPAFCAFPEHFFTDLCDLVYFLGLHRVDSSELTAAWAHMRDEQPDDDDFHQVDLVEVVEPIFVLLVQVMLSPASSSKVALRAGALKALPSLVSFFSQCAACRSALDGVLQRNAFLMNALVPGLVRFHHEVDACSGNGHRQSQISASDSDGNTMSEDSTLDHDNTAAAQFEGDVTGLRACVATVLQYLWQLPAQRVTMDRVLSPRESQGDWMACCRADFSVLVDAMWGDMTRLVEEANDKITVLRHLRELLDSSDRGRGVSLPIRPHMMDGYVALHSKQLRLTFRTLIEVLETALWMADAAPPRTVLLSQSEAEQCARALCFALSNVAQAVESRVWELSVHVLADGKRVLAHLVYLVLLCANGQDVGAQVNADDRTARRELVRTCGTSMMNRLGDLGTRVRWNVQATIVERGQQVDGEPTVLASSWSRARFLAHLARDGRFDGDRFVQCLDVLRQPSEGAEVYEYVDARCVRAFVSVMMDVTCMSALRESVEALVADAPEEFQDPLLGSLMANPVCLPSSGKIVDRAVIARHLRAFRGAVGCDPFTRAPLTLGMVSPCPSLARDVRAFVASKLSGFDAATATSALLVLGFEDAVGGDDGLHHPRGVKRSHDVMVSSAEP